MIAEETRSVAAGHAAVLERARQAARVQGSLTLVGKVTNVVFMVLLARLLMPEDYGYYTVAMLVAGFVTVFSNFGIQAYLIQKQGEIGLAGDLCYTLNLGLATLLGGGVALGAVLWPQTIDSTLRLMIGLYGLHIFVSALSYIPLALLKRELNFRASAQAELTYSVSSSGLRVLFAVLGLGALCFPLADICAAVLRNLVARHYADFRGKLILAHSPLLREVGAFGGYTVLVSLASFFANQFDKILVAATFPLKSVGAYTFASQQAGLPINGFVVPQEPVFFSMIARSRNEPEALNRSLTASVRFIVSWLLPMYAFLIIEAEAVIRVVFTEKWLPAVVLIQLIAIERALKVYAIGVAAGLIGLGRADLAARIKWINALMLMASLGVAVWQQAPITGYALAYAIGNGLGTVNTWFANVRLLGIRPRDFFAGVIAPTVITGASAATIVALGGMVRAGSPVVDLLAAASVFGSVFLLLTALFNREILLHARWAMRWN